jgi:hypothetical protein
VVVPSDVVVPYDKEVVAGELVDQEIVMPDVVTPQETTYEMVGPAPEEEGLVTGAEAAACEVVKV